MRHQPMLIFLLTLLALFVGAPRVQAKDHVVQQIPDNALAYVVVKNMEQASHKINQTAQRMQLPGVDLLRMITERLSLQGVVDTGDMALVVVGRESESPFPVVFLRTDRYEELISQLSPDQREDGISRVIVGGERSLVGKKGEYAVFTQTTYRDDLKRVVESQVSVKTDDRLQTFTQNADVYAVATSSGVKLLSQQARGAMQTIRREFAEQGTQTGTVTAGLAMYEELFAWASDEVGQVVLALELREDGVVALTKRVAFQNAVEYTVRGSAAGATEQLAHLPKWPYVMAMAGEIGDSKAIDQWMRLSMNMMRAMVSPKQLDDQQMEKLMGASRKSMQGLRNMAFTFGVPTAGGSIYSRMGMVMEVEDAKTYIENYVVALQQVQEIFAENEAIPYRILTAERAQVAGVPGIRIVMQITPAALGSTSDQVTEMIGKLYGKDGKIEIFAAPVDARRVAFAYVSEESLRDVMAAAKSADGLATAEGLHATAKLLSSKAQLVGYLSPEGSVQYVQRMIETLVPLEQREQIPHIPPFPSSPPLGFSLHFNGKVLQAELVAAPETLTALGKYIETIRQAAIR